MNLIDVPTEEVEALLSKLLAKITHETNATIKTKKKKKKSCIYLDSLLSDDITTGENIYRILHFLN